MMDPIDEIIHRHHSEADTRLGEELARYVGQPATAAVVGAVALAHLARAKALMVEAWGQRTAAMVLYEEADKLATRGS